MQHHPLQSHGLYMDSYAQNIYQEQHMAVRNKI